MSLSKIFLGISLSAPFGPLSAAALNRGMQSGFSGAFSVRLGGVVGNLLCLTIAFFFISLLYKLESLNFYITIFSSVILIALGARQYTNSKKLNIDAPKQHRSNSDLVTGFILAVFNPFGIIWWLSVYSASVSDSEAEINTIAAYYENLYIILGVLIWITIFSGIIGIIREKFPLKVLKIITQASSISLICYGVYYVYIGVIKIIS